MAVAAKKTTAKKPAGPALPEPVELTFELDRSTPGTHVWAEVEAEDGSVVVGKMYTKKGYFGGYVPPEGSTITVTVQVNAPE